MKSRLFPKIEDAREDCMKQRVEFLRVHAASFREIAVLLRKDTKEIQIINKRPYHDAPDTGPLSGWKYESEDLLEALRLYRAKDPSWKNLIGDF